MRNCNYFYWQISQWILFSFLTQLKQILLYNNYKWWKQAIMYLHMSQFEYEIQNKIWSHIQFLFHFVGTLEI